MSFHEYQHALELVKDDTPFYGLIMAAYIRADSHNATRLRMMFPNECAEADARYNTRGGKLPGEHFTGEVHAPLEGQTPTVTASPPTTGT